MIRAPPARPVLAAASRRPRLQQRRCPRRPASRRRPTLHPLAATSTCPPPPPPPPATVAAAAGAVVLTGVVNRLLYKGALEAVGPTHTLFLALLQASAPAAAYAAVLAFRVARGRVTPAELACVAWGPASVIGAGEAASSTLGFVAATRLPGAALPMLAQSMLVWQLLIDRLVLGQRVSWRRGLGAALVVAGVVAAAWPRVGVAAAIPLAPAALFAGAQLFPAAAALAKQSIFESACATLGRPLDVFVLTARASAAQAACVAVALPLTAAAKGVAATDVPAHLAAGCAAVAGCGPLPALYILANIAFNVALISMLRLAGAFVYSVAAAAIVPAAIFAFSLPWPFLPPPPALGPYFVIGAVALVAGLGVVTAAGVGGGSTEEAPLIPEAGLETA